MQNKPQNLHNFSDHNYSKREIDILFSNLTDKLQSTHTEILEKIEDLDDNNDKKHIENTNRLQAIDTKVTFTNGKVRKLEKWQAALIMAGSASIVLIGIIIGLVVYIYQYQLNIQTGRITNLKATINQLQEK